MEKLNIDTLLRLSILSLLLIFAGCATTGNGGVSNSSSDNGNSSSSVSIVESSNDSLTDHLRRFAGVRVIGDGPNAQIIIREKSSFLADTSPLFVVNGIRAGKDFSRIYSMLNPSDITKIEVLKDTRTSLYGMDGANGVIVISTRN